MVLIKYVENYYVFLGKTINFDYFYQAILSGSSWILIILYIILECKSKKNIIAILELEDPYEQIFVGHPVFLYISLY